ncbi:MAG: hypothetical protein MI920_34535 [Kiloniellales bacterium]|nr:hypothetical protein [Kiloniellales bacterium]
MYTLTRLLTVREFLLQQAPTLVVSLALAEVFYKFGSFLLEAVAFLVTWYVLDAARQFITDSMQRK